MNESAAPVDPAAPPPRCLACGAAGAEPWAVAWDAEYRTSEDRFRYLRCGRCGVLYIDPVPTDRLAEIYPTNYYAYVSGERSFVHRVKDWLDSRRLRRILRSIPGERLAVLDVGGGDGWQLSLIRRLDPRVASTFVVDMDPEAEAHARRQGHGYFCGRIEDFEASQRFDLVLLLNLIEHVAEPERVLARLRAGLSEHGIILVKTPNHDSLDARCFRRHNWAGFHCPRHWVLFERESFRTLAARAGLAVRELGYTQGAAFWANSVLFALAERGVVSITRERPAMSHPLFPLLAAPFAAFDLARAALGGRPSQMFVTLTRA